jgi:hypothetical protein
MPAEFLTDFGNVTGGHNDITEVVLFQGRTNCV